MLYLKIFRDISFIMTPLPLMVVMTFMIAMMCILLGLLAEMIMRTFYESQGKSVYNIRETRNIGETNWPVIGTTEAIGKMESPRKYREDSQIASENLRRVRGFLYTQNQTMVASKRDFRFRQI